MTLEVQGNSPEEGRGEAILVAAEELEVCVDGMMMGGLSVGAFAVAGGVEMPLGTFSAAGEAIVPVM